MDGRFLIGLFLLSLILFSGCVARSSPSPLPTFQVTVVPTATPSVTIQPTIGPIISPSPTVNPIFIPANSTFECGPLENESAYVQIRGPAVFSIGAKFQSTCADYDAYWSREGPYVLALDFKTRPAASPKPCIKCIGMDAVSATLDLTMLSSIVNLEKLVVRKDGKMIFEKYFEGTFCGGIAAFPCPTGYECILDGSFPDAGGKCTLRHTEYGTLQGKVTIGPFCPVERQDEPCRVPPEAYASRKLTATGPNGQEKLMLIDIGPDGAYSVWVAPGVYIIDLQRSGMDSSAELPKTVKIEAGKAATLDISIDTGIR